MTEQRPINAEDIFALRFLQSAALSPDGRHAVFALAEVDANRNEDQVSLCLLDLENGERSLLTGVGFRDLDPVWAPDGSRIAFRSTRAGRPQLFTIEVGGGEPLQVTDLPNGVGGAANWSPDGTMLTFSMGSQDEERHPDHAFRVTRAVYRFDGIGYIEDSLQSIAMVELESGVVTGLTHDRSRNTNPVWCADGTTIAYIASFDPDSAAPYSRVRTVDPRGNVRDFDHPVGMVSRLRPHADGRLVFKLEGREDRLPGSNSELWVLNPETGMAECRTGVGVEVASVLQEDTPVLSQAPIVLDGDDAIVSVANGGIVEIRRIALTGTRSSNVVVTGERSCFPVGVGAGRLLYVAMGVNQPGDLFTCDLRGRDEQQQTAINNELLERLALPTVTRLSYPSSDGVMVEGWFYAPPGSVTPYPTVVNIHGGPHTAFGNTFSCDVQRLVGAGYGVLQVNHRGSTGYGVEFGTAAIGDRGNLDYEDIIAGVDHAISLGLTDAHRMGLFGISGGGNLSCWIVGQTNRFKAAVPENPVTNFVSLYGVSDVGTSLIPHELAGTPVDNAEAYRRSSPVTYAHKCTTPTLMIQSEGDLRALPEQAEQFYAILKAYGCETEMLRLPKVFHDGSRRGPVHIRRAQNEALVEWMDRFVRDSPSGAIAHG